MIDQLDNFLTKGYARYSVPNLLDPSQFTLTNVEIEDDLKDIDDPNENILLQEFVNYVNEHFVEKVFKNFEVRYVNTWDGVDYGSLEWHNDKIEGFDFNVLYYFDSMTEETGGAIEFKYQDGETKIYPQAGDLIFINQDVKFQHRANRSTISRRVASIEYKIL